MSEERFEVTCAESMEACKRLLKSCGADEQKQDRLQHVLYCMARAVKGSSVDRTQMLCMAYGIMSAYAVGEKAAFDNIAKCARALDEL